MRRPVQYVISMQPVHGFIRCGVDEYCCSWSADSDTNYVPLMAGSFKLGASWVTC